MPVSVQAKYGYGLTPSRAPLSFVGHTHVHEIWTEGREEPVQWPKSGTYALEPGRKAAINVGSVGFPRGSDKRATWATYDDEKGEVTLRRTAYDVQEIIRTIKHLRHDPVLEAKLLKDLSA